MEENIALEPEGKKINKVKGLSWMLQGINTKENKGTQQAEIEKKIKNSLMSQSKKWRKITNDRFQGYGKKIERFVESSFKKDDESYS